MIVNPHWVGLHFVWWFKVDSSRIFYISRTAARRPDWPEIILKLPVRGQWIRNLAEISSLGGDRIVPNSNVNDDGKPNVNRNNVTNRNNTRVVVGGKIRLSFWGVDEESEMDPSPPAGGSGWQALLQALAPATELAFGFGELSLNA